MKTNTFCLLEVKPDLKTTSYTEGIQAAIHAIGYLSHVHKSEKEFGVLSDNPSHMG